MVSSPPSSLPEKDIAPTEGKCVSIIFNPVSGNINPELRKKLISETLAQYGYTCQYLATSKEEGAKALAQKALEDGVDLIAVSGGDGTVMEVLAATVGTDVPVAVLPAGTGNLLSINLGIPTTVPEAVHVALSGRRYKLDLAKSDGDRYFAIIGGLGLDAQMIVDAGREAKKRLGALAYFVAAIKNLGRRRAHVHISLDGAPEFGRRAKSVLVANMGKITGGVEAMPTAVPNDGLLDIGILKAHTLGHLLHLVGSTLLGRAHDDPQLEVYQARQVSIRTRHPQPCQFDGEEAGRRQEWHVEVIPQAVQILLPEDAPAVRSSHSPPAQTARQNTVQKSLGLGTIALVGLALSVTLWFKRRQH